MIPLRERVLATLLLVNVWLQVFDGIATYFGLRAGYGEGNPLVAATALRFGTIPTLLVFKLFACACLLMIWRLRGRSMLALPALLTAAAAYLVCSLAPWSVALAAL
jgi:uncharacterized membrane protein